MERERRIITTCPVRFERRTDADGKDHPVISGYAAVFYKADDPGTEFQLYPGLRERIMPTAFDRAVREKQDCRGLFNHNPDNLLARCSSGTMRLSLDTRGLGYEMDYDPEDLDHQRVKRKLERGDLTGSSFSFNVRMQKFVYSADPDGDDDDIRELHDVDLFDVGPVTFPAYDATSAGMRAEVPGELRSAWKAWRRDNRGAVTFAAGPVIDSDKWDADAALARVRAWASQGDQLDYAKFKRAFAWFDPDKEHEAAGYKLPHHDVRDGKLHVHKKGVIAAMGSLLGSRGGADIPDGQRRAVYDHLARHYRDQLEMDAPEFHSARVQLPPPELALDRLRLAEAG